MCWELNQQLPGSQAHTEPYQPGLGLFLRDSISPVPKKVQSLDGIMIWGFLWELHCKTAHSCHYSSLRSFSNAFANRWKLSLNTCHSTIQVYCWWVIVFGSVHSNTNRYWGSGWTGMPKKASFSLKLYTTEYSLVLEWVWCKCCLQEDGGQL